LSKIRELKGEGVIGGRRKLHNEKLHDLYGDKIKMIRTGPVAGIQQKRNAYRVLAWKLNERKGLEDFALIWGGSDVDRSITCSIFSLGKQSRPRHIVC